jgi:hypothetical protein
MFAHLRYRTRHHRRRTHTHTTPKHPTHTKHAQVILVVPWLEEEDQKQVFPPGVTFATREAHAEFILGEARARSQLPCGFRVMFYEGVRGGGIGDGWLRGRLGVVDWGAAGRAAAAPPQRAEW